MRGMCFNWKVIAGLAVLGLGAWLWVPSLTVAALPLLLAVACPLSMLLMMRGMQHGQCSSQPTTLPQPTLATRSREEQLAELRAQHEAIGRQLSELGTDETPVRMLPGPQPADVPGTASARG